MRTLDLDALVLQRGSHSGPEHGGCIMEWASFMAGEPWSDTPACVSPVLSAFLRRWQDDLDDAGRQKLKPYLPRVLDTAGNAKADEQRAWLVTDWLVRVYTPAWLDLAGLTVQATTLRALPPILSTAVAQASQPSLEGARKDADAAWAAAWAAARDAAWAAANQKVQPTVVSLQASAFDLLDRMITCTGE